jgi:hypothetical protein
MLPKFEVASGVVDGVNQIFSVSSPYSPNSVAVFLNGQLKRADFADGWVELSPSTGLVQLLIAPLPGDGENPDDVVQIFYLDPSVTGLVEKEVSPLSGVIRVSSDLKARISSDDLAGVLLPLGSLEGALEGFSEIGGTMVPVTSLNGRILECV